MYIHKYDAESLNVYTCATMRETVCKSCVLLESNTAAIATRRHASIHSSEISIFNRTANRQTMANDVASNDDDGMCGNHGCVGKVCGRLRRRHTL